LTINRHRDDDSSSDVTVGVSGGPGRDEDAGVDDRREDRDTGGLDRDDPGRRVGVAGSRDEVGVVAGYDHSDDDSAEDVWYSRTEISRARREMRKDRRSLTEERDTVSNTLDGFRDRLVRVGGFSSSDDDSLYSDEREGGVDEGGDESGKVSTLARETVRLSPRSGIVPVAESATVVIGSSSESDDETDDDLRTRTATKSQQRKERTGRSAEGERQLTRPRKQRTLIIEVMNSDSP
jgi:hypothetical protein